MDKFLEKIQLDLDTKILLCIKGESIIKPFSQVFEEVRDKKIKKSRRASSVFPNEESIYKKVIEDFLREHPELIRQEN